MPTTMIKKYSQRVLSNYLRLYGDVSIEIKDVNGASFLTVQQVKKKVVKFLQ